MYTKEKTVEKRVCSRTELNKLELKPTRSNAQEHQPVNIAYGLYVSTTYGQFHKSEFRYSRTTDAIERAA